MRRASLRSERSFLWFFMGFVGFSELALHIEIILDQAGDLGGVLDRLGED